MADRTSAALFADVFEMLAADGRFDRASLANYFYEQSRGYDFSWQQMGCDEALKKLGLLHRGVEPGYEQYGETWLYGPAPEAEAAPTEARADLREDVFEFAERTAVLLGGLRNYERARLGIDLDGVLLMLPEVMELLDKIRTPLRQAVQFECPTPRETQASISRWADETFGPVSSNARVAARANEEMAELLRALTSDDAHPKAAEEVADVFIVLYRVATRLGVDLHEVIDAKMAVNRARVWATDGTGHGYHVRKKE